LEYKQIQSVNINYMEGGSAAISSSDLDLLSTIGQTTTPSSSYARSLYHSITEQRIELPKFYVDQEVKLRDRKKVDVNVSCYPNPVHVGGNSELT